MSIVVTAGQSGDSPQFEPVLEKVRVPRMGSGRPRVRLDRVRADKAYDSRSNRSYLRRHRDQGHDLGACGPGPQPPQTRIARRPAAEVRRRRRQAAAGSRVRDQPAQASPCRRYQVRQTCCPL
ncbi:transposase [Streptomyces tanashiensis]